jgi:hypothetical protein
MSGLEHLSESQKAEAAAHDKAVATLSNAAVIAAATDLCRRRPHDRKDPEQRWTLACKAALLREVKRRNLTPDDA